MFLMLNHYYTYCIFCSKIILCRHVFVYLIIVFDKDGEGSFGVGEIRHVLTNLGEYLTDEEVNEVLREVDIDGDGTISFQGLFSLMLSKF